MSTINVSRLPKTSAPRGTRRSRSIASFALIGCTALFFCQSVDLGADSHSSTGVLDRFLAASSGRLPVAYRAVRRLEASSTKLKATGWVEALTEFDPLTGLQIRILGEGGSGRVRGALKGVLEAEREATLPGRSGNAALTAENYMFQPGPVDLDGLVAMRVTPRRRDPALVDGTIFVALRMGPWCASKDGWPRVRRSGRVRSMSSDTTLAVPDGPSQWKSGRSPMSKSPARHSSS